jgi:hypothetical protein
VAAAAALPRTATRKTKAKVKSLPLLSGRTLCRGYPWGSPNNREKTHFSQNNKTQTNSQTVNCTPHNHGLVTGAHGPGNLSGPPSGRSQHPSGETPLRSRGTTSYRRNSASLEGWTPPWVKLRLTQGLDAPSGETPPRLRAARPLG